MKTERRKTGDLGENIAAEFLRRKGFRILDRNFLRPWGELDLVADRQGIVHIIEVKTISREIGRAGSRENTYRPEEQITALKLKKLARTAALYMEQKHDSREFQIDAVTVELDTEARVARCRYYAQVL